MVNKDNNPVKGVVKGGVCVALAVLGYAYFSYSLSRSFNKQSINAQHVLADKVGFKYHGKLKDGRDFDYDIRDIVGNAWEVVRIEDNKDSRLIDWNHDKNVDRIEFGYNVEIDIKSPGKFKYDSSKLDKTQVEFIVETANQLYSEALSSQDLEKKLKSYSTRIQGNPLLPEPQAEKAN